MTAKIRVEGRGACYIPSNEIAQLPEVKEMQRLAAIIVRKDMEDNKIMSNIEKLECIRESLEAFEIMSYKVTGHLIMLQEVINDLKQSEFDIESEKWDNRELGCEEEHVKISPDSEELKIVKYERDLLLAENKLMLKLLTDISENHVEYFSEGECGMFAGVPLDYVSEINMYVSRDVNAENPFLITDSAIAFIEAQGVEKFGTWASEQESFASEAGDKKEARIYCHVSARAKHFAKSLLEGKI